MPRVAIEQTYCDNTLVWVNRRSYEGILTPLNRKFKREKKGDMNEKKNRTNFDSP